MLEIMQIYLDGLKAEEIQQLFADGPISALVGSGVSSFCPTNLPTGQAFTNSLYESLFFDGTNNDADHQKDKLNEQNKEVKRLFENFLFERAMERCPEQDKLHALVKEFFDEKNPNPVHEALARGLVEQRFESIVTTNYDCCIDVAIGFRVDSTPCSVTGNVRRVIFRPEDQPLSLNLHERVYFKIHGSTDDPTGESLVFTTRQETALDDCKRRLLKRLWADRILLIIGYSGLDFEICPEIEGIKPKRIIWNFYRTEDIKTSALRVLRRTPGLILIGDMCKLLAPLLGEVRVKRAELKDFKKEIAKHFTPFMRRLWWARILVAMTCAGPALRACEELLKEDIGDDENRIILLKEYAGALYYKGSYKQAARRLEKAVTIAQKLPGYDVAELCNLYITIYDCWRNHRSYRRKRKYLKLARSCAQRCKGKSKKEVAARVELKRLDLLSRLYTCTKFLRLTKLATIFQERARSIITPVIATFAKAGSPFDFQQMEEWSKRFDIPVESIKPQDLYAPPPSREGYIHIGDLMGQMRIFQDEAKKAGKEDGFKIVYEAEIWAKLAETLEIYPSAWKLRVLIARLSFWNDRKHFWSSLRLGWSDYMQCEYFAPMRIILFLVRIIS
jgi:tetratricopeptide (TPR) repeat protein